MKKLLAIAAVAAAAPLFAVESANTVGYMNVNLAENAFNWVAPNFQALTGTLKFSDIAVNENVTFGGTTIQLLDEGGATQVINDSVLGSVDAMFRYVDAVRAAKKGCDEGWYFVDDTGYESCQNDRVVMFGSGICVDCSDSDAALVFSGQVKPTDTEIALSENAFTWTGNVSPVDITFGDLVPNENVTFGGTTIQLLDEGGATMVLNDSVLGSVDAMFRYVDATRAAKKGCDVGWYFVDDSGYESCQNARVIPAAAGICVDCSDSEATVTVPKAL